MRRTMAVRKARIWAAAIIMAGMAGTASAQAPEENVLALDAAPTIGSENLGDLRGRNGDTSITVQSNQSLEASVAGSTINADTINSGAVTIQENALQNFSGVGLFNLNTGNNNSINNAVGVTFNLQ